MNGCVPRCR